MLLDGIVEVVEEGSDGERVLSTVEPVESMGELAVLGHMPRSATLRARSDVTVLTLPGEELHGWLRRHPDLALRLMARILVSKDAHR